MCGHNLKHVAAQPLRHCQSHCNVYLNFSRGLALTLCSATESCSLQAWSQNSAWLRVETDRRTARSKPRRVCQDSQRLPWRRKEWPPCFMDSDATGVQVLVLSIQARLKSCAVYKSTSDSLRSRAKARILYCTLQTFCVACRMSKVEYSMLCFSKIPIACANIGQNPQLFQQRVGHRLLREFAERLHFGSFHEEHNLQAGEIEANLGIQEA